MKTRILELGDAVAAAHEEAKSIIKNRVVRLLEEGEFHGRPARVNGIYIDTDGRVTIGVLIARKDADFKTFCEADDSVLWSPEFMRMVVWNHHTNTREYRCFELVEWWDPEHKVWTPNP